MQTILLTCLHIHDMYFSWYERYMSSSLIVVAPPLIQEVRLAIEYIVIPGGEPVELLPRRSEIFALQLELVESYQLAVENTGTEMNPRMQILPHKLNKRTSANNSKRSASLQEGFSIQAVPNKGVGTSVPQLPLLPE